MPSPFPGMDPYIEDPLHWRNVHSALINECQAQLNRLLRPRYVASTEERLFLVPDDDPAERQLRVPDVYVERIRSPRRDRGGGVAVAGFAATEHVEMVTLRDPEVREYFLEIRATDTREVVTILEILSPTNKLAGSEGRRSFLAKRAEITASPVHWVEIDLLRAGDGLPARLRLTPHDYAVHVSPADLRPRGRVWPIRLEQRLPKIGIPLRAPDLDVALDLQEVLTTAYDRAALDLVADYGRDPVPPLPPEQAAWADGILRAGGHR